MIPLTSKKIKHIISKKVARYAKKISTNDDDKKYYKFRDHCQFTGKYRVAAHDIYNLI